MPNPGASPEDAAPKDEGLEGRAHFPLSAAVEHYSGTIPSPGNSAGHKTLPFLLRISVIFGSCVILSGRFLG